MTGFRVSKKTRSVWGSAAAETPAAKTPGTSAAPGSHKEKGAKKIKANDNKASSSKPGQGDEGWRSTKQVVLCAGIGGVHFFF